MRPNLYSGHLRVAVFPDCLAKIRQQSSCRCFHVEKRHFLVPTPGSEAGYRQGKGAALYFEHFMCSWDSGTSGPIVFPVRDCLTMLPRRKTSFSGSRPRARFREAGSRQGMVLHFVSRAFSVLPALGNLGSMVLPDCLTKIRQQSSCRCFDVEKRHFRFPGPHRVPRLVIDEGRVLHFISSIFCAPGTREPRVPGFSGLSDENPAAIELQVLPRRKTSFSGSHTEFRGWFSTREGCCTLFRAFSVLPALGNLGTTRHPGTVPGPKTG